MAQNMLMQDGFFRRPTVPPAWTNPANNRNTEAAPETNPAIRTAGHNIRAAMDVLSGRSQSVIVGLTSDNGVATVQVDTARTIASLAPQNTTIDVRQTASAQVNEGDDIDADAPWLAGDFTFEIEADGRVEEFTIAVTADDDNASVQRRMMEAVNASDIGVRAAVTADNTAGTSRLTFTGTQTGAENSFEVRDVDGGTLASAMGVTAATTEARNAVFTVNGGFERQSQTNEVVLGAGVTATLQGEGRTEITFQRSAEDTVSAVTDLVGAVNAALRNVNASQGRGNAAFVSDIHAMNRTFESSLARVGIGIAENGQLTIDQSRLQAASEDGSLDRMFNSNTGFAGRLSRIADNAASSRLYRNTPSPVNVTAPNGFDFNNANDPWSMLSLFG